MTPLQAVLYGVIQGLTEFLPVSSSAHLILLPWLFKWKDPGLAFDVALHWGTLIGLVVYLRNDIKELFKGWLGSYFGGQSPINILPWQIMIASIPAALAGYLFEEKAETAFRSPWVLATTLAGVGVLLFLSDRLLTNRIPLEKMTWKKALAIGLAQGLAIIPGVSRSGITITTALFLGLDRQSSVRFSFLLSLPIIFGAGILKLGYLLKNLENPLFGIGILSSALSGYVAIFALMNFVKTRTFTPFVIYRIALALLIILLQIRA